MAKKRKRKRKPKWPMIIKGVNLLIEPCAGETVVIFGHQWLYPGEARRLAQALLDAADEAEARKA